MTRATENSAAQENLAPQSGGLTIPHPLRRSLEFAQQIKQQQHRLEDRFGGIELLQTKVVGPQVMLQLTDALLHVRPAVIIPPNLLRRGRAGSDEDAETVPWNFHQELARTPLFAYPFPLRNQPCTTKCTSANMANRG